MKPIYKITVLSLLSVLLVSCEKEMETIEKTTDVLFSEQIENMDEYLTGFKTKISSPLKSGEMLSLEVSRWHLSALLNFYYADAKTHYEFFPVDTFYTTLSLSNQLVSLQELNDAFNELSGFVTSAFYAIESDDKTLIVAEVGIDSIVNNEAEIRVVSTMGYNPPAVNFGFGETDWWYWGVGGHYGHGPGKCGEYAGQEVGSDASVALTKRANQTIPLRPERVYFTDLVTFWIHPDHYPVDPEVHPFGRHSLLFLEFQMPYQPPPPWSCLCPDEMNYYLFNLIHIIEPDNRPAGKVIAKYRVESDILIVPDDYWLHWAFLTYGVPTTTTLPTR